MEPMNWTTVVMDLQRSVNNLALYVLESMTPPLWLANVDVTQPPPGYKGTSTSSSEAMMDKKSSLPSKPCPTKDPKSSRKKKMTETR
jgi:hypothetical protein